MVRFCTFLQVKGDKLSFLVTQRTIEELLKFREEFQQLIPIVYVKVSAVFVYDCLEVRLFIFGIQKVQCMLSGFLSAFWFVKHAVHCPCSLNSGLGGQLVDVPHRQCDFINCDCLCPKIQDNSKLS